MLFALIRKEVRAHVLSLRFAITFVLLVSVVLVSISLLAADHLARVDAFESSRAYHRELLEEIARIEDPGDRMGQLIFERGVYSDRPPQPLAIFARGLDDDLPTQVHTSMSSSRRVAEALYRNPIRDLFAAPALAYIVGVVASLLALLFAFDAVCGEKERGTLKLVLANAVPRDVILLSKWIGAYVTLAAPLLVACLAAVVFVRLSGTLQLSGDAVARLVGLTSISLLYVFLCLGVGMAISTLTHKSSTALLVSLLVWVCWIVVIPNLAPVLGRLLSPVPTLNKVNAEKRAIDEEVRIQVDRIDRRHLGYGSLAQRQRERAVEDGEQRKKRIERFYEERLQRQIDTSKALSRLSPAASFRYASTDFAGTGLGLYTAFRAAYHRFQEQFRDYGEGISRARSESRLADDWLQVDDVPGLRLLPQGVGLAADAALTDILLLAVYAVLFFSVSYLAFLRYDVT